MWTDSKGWRVPAGGDALGASLLRTVLLRTGSPEDNSPVIAGGGEGGGILTSRKEYRLNPSCSKLLVRLLLTRFQEKLWKSQKNKKIKKNGTEVLSVFIPSSRISLGAFHLEQRYSSIPVAMWM
jgi:hypothetical protein